MMIERPNNLIIVEANFEFNGLLINEIEIDLDHVNFGRNMEKKRSSFEADFVSKVCLEFFSNKYLKDVGQQQFGDDLCLYFKLEEVFRNERYKMVICICTDKPNTIGVITMYKIEEK